MSTDPSYAEACREAATVQGLDPITDALTAAGIDHRVDQTGGFCMVVATPLKGTAYIGVTAEGARSDGKYLAIRYADAEDLTGTVVADEGDTEAIVRTTRAEQVIDRYDDIVRSNTTPRYDAVRAVATDEAGEVIWEVLDTASSMGVAVDDDIRDALQDATERYQARLRAEIAASTSRTTITAAPPYTARQCPECDTWVYVADGPFAEGDQTKTLADFIHYERHHTPEVLPGRAGAVIGIPYFSYNETTVDAVKEAPAG